MSLLTKEKTQSTVGTFADCYKVAFYSRNASPLLLGASFEVVNVRCFYCEIVKGQQIVKSCSLVSITIYCLALGLI